MSLVDPAGQPLQKEEQVPQIRTLWAQTNKGPVVILTIDEAIMMEDDQMPDGFPVAEGHKNIVLPATAAMQLALGLTQKTKEAMDVAGRGEEPVDTGSA